MHCLLPKLCLAHLRNKNLGNPLIFNNKYISEDEKNIICGIWKPQVSGLLHHVAELCVHAEDAAWSQHCRILEWFGLGGTKRSAGSNHLPWAGRSSTRPGCSRPWVTSMSSWQWPRDAAHHSWQEERCRGVSEAASGAAQSNTYWNKSRSSWGSKHLMKMTPLLCIILIFSYKMPVFVVTSTEDSEVSLLQKSQGQGQKQLNYISKLLSHNAQPGLRPHLDQGTSGQQR